MIAVKRRCSATRSAARDRAHQAPQASPAVGDCLNHLPLRP